MEDQQAILDAFKRKMADLEVGEGDAGCKRLMLARRELHSAAAAADEASEKLVSDGKQRGFEALSLREGSTLVDEAQKSHSFVTSALRVTLFPLLKSY